MVRRLPRGNREIGAYRKWLEAVPEDKYSKVFKTRKEAEKYASELQNRICLGKADKPKKTMIDKFQLEHKQVMKGQVAHGILQEHM